MEQPQLLEYLSLRDFCKTVKPGSVEKDVLNQVSILSLELFGEDCVEVYSQPGKAGRLWVLYDFGPTLREKKGLCPSMASVSTEVSEIESESDEEMPEPGCGGRPRLLGFLVAKLLNNFKLPKIGGEALSVVYTGVPLNLRGNGYGKKLVSSCLATGRERKNIAVVTLSALPGAVAFWEHVGFTPFPDAMEVKDGMVAGQIYMEASVRGKNKKTTRKGKKPLI